MRFVRLSVFCLQKQLFCLAKAKAKANRLFGILILNETRYVFLENKVQYCLNKMLCRLNEMRTSFLVFAKSSVLRSKM